MDNHEAHPPLDSCTEGGALEELGQCFQMCIEEVGRLEARRDSLVQEMCALREPMLEATRALREELSSVLRQKAQAELQCQSLQEDICQVKRSLFATTRACIQCQFTLETQRHDVAQFSISRELLQSQLLQLSEELSQLRAARQARLDSLNTQAHNSHQARADGDLSDCRRASLDLERYLKEGIKTLEDFYEPRVLGQLKRRQMSAEALRRTREQTAEMKGRLWPLQEELQRLTLQRSCLEERAALMQIKRDEDVRQYRETLETLEESVRELKIEVKLQKKRNEEIESLKNSLSKELDVYK
ncbi:SYNCI protein, partial [Amia calva]|nr:SYNCI protein [Amia calva]